MFICILHKFSSHLILFWSLVGSVFGFIHSLFSSLVRHICIVSFFVSFALPLFCILHVWSLLVMYFMFIPVFVILLFSVTVPILCLDRIKFGYVLKRVQQ